jgi:serine/threonine-protein kinase
VTAEVEPGDIIAGRYRLQRRIGDGGMGVVWAATHMESGKEVALKHLRSEASGDAETHKRFLREAQATASIAHPNIVTVHELVETEGGLPAIVMDLLDGEPLRMKLDREKRLSIADAAAILLPTISAVGTAHAIGIVHRDLKPDNIFIAITPGPSGEAGERTIKVLDFGIAKLTKTGNEVSTASVITGTWSLLGTPHYMSPEQIIGEKDIDHRADIWAIGAILYECLAGIRPAEAKTPGKIFELILLRGIKPLGSVAPGTPADVAALVDRMLARERDDRPWDLHEVEAVLARYTSVKAPPFGKPSALRLSHPDAADRKRASREKADVVAPPVSDPLSTTAPDLRSMMADLSFDDAPPTMPASTSSPSQSPTLDGPELAGAMQKAQGGLEVRMPQGSKGDDDAAPPDAAPMVEEHSPARKLAAFTLAAVVAFAAAAGGVGAWLLASNERAGGAAPPGSASAGALGGATGGSASPSGACPPEMAFIAGGAFLMGSSEGREDERPVHRVEVRAFCLDRSEVTVAAYSACVVEGACTPAEATVTWNGIAEEAKRFESSDCLAHQNDRMDHPINCIDWNQADKFCRARGKRLPTEEEWEYAARGGGKQRRHPWGDAPPGQDLANVCGGECRAALKKRGRELPAGAAMTGDDGFATTAPVGRFPKGDSQDGVHDLTGNVWEWTASPYCPYPSHTCSNPARVFRGSGWMTYLQPHFLPTTRLYSHPTHRYADIGFRCASASK